MNFIPRWFNFTIMSAATQLWWWRSAPTSLKHLLWHRSDYWLVMPELGSQNMTLSMLGGDEFSPLTLSPVSACIDILPSLASVLWDYWWHDATLNTEGRMDMRSRSRLATPSKCHHQPSQSIVFITWWFNFSPWALTPLWEREEVWCQWEQQHQPHHGSTLDFPCHC